MKTTYFFHDRPLFGIDISTGAVHVMQVSASSTGFEVIGYGEGNFDPAAIQDGVVVNPGVVAQAIRKVLDNAITGKITAGRVALSIPASRTFSRAISLPKLEAKELEDAVMLEVEQYTPVAIDSLYVDYTPIHQSASENELFAVAVPKQVVDSYLQVTQLLDLEAVLVETHVDATRRLFSMTEFGTIPSVVIDFHMNSADISIVDNNLIATGNVSLEAMPITTEPPTDSTNTASAETPANSQLDVLIKEVRRLIRYYQERYDKSHQIEQIVLLGDEVILPGLASLMTDQLRLPVRSSDPWQKFHFSNDAPALPKISRDNYMVAAGLAAASHKQVLA